MAETSEVYLGNGSDHTTIEISSIDYFGFCGDAALKPISQDTYQENTIKTNATMTSNGGVGQNCQYVSPTTVSLNGAAAVTLNTTNVPQLNVTSRWQYGNDDGSTTTALSDILFFAYNGSVTVAPSNVTITAFERTASAITVDTVAGTGYAWNNSYGIGNINNALEIPDRSTPAVDHDFYIGLSAKPTDRGLNANITFRLEFNVT